MSKRVIRVVCAAIVRDERYLITQRKEKAVFPLLWEFPGGRVEDGETDEAALARELLYRLGIEAVIGEELSNTRQEYQKYIVDMHLYACDVGEQTVRPVAVHDLAWALSEEFEKYDFTPADQDSMDALLGERAIQ